MPFCRHQPLSLNHCPNKAQPPLEPPHVLAGSAPTAIPAATAVPETEPSQDFIKDMKAQMEDASREVRAILLQPGVCQALQQGSSPPISLPTFEPEQPAAVTGFIFYEYMALAVTRYMH